MAQVTLGDSPVNSITLPPIVDGSTHGNSIDSEACKAVVVLSGAMSEARVDESSAVFLLVPSSVGQQPDETPLVLNHRVDLLVVAVFNVPSAVLKALSGGAEAVWHVPGRGVVIVDCFVRHDAARLPRVHGRIQDEDGLFDVFQGLRGSVALVVVLRIGVLDAALVHTNGGIGELKDGLHLSRHDELVVDVLPVHQEEAGDWSRPVLEVLRNFGADEIVDVIGMQEGAQPACRAARQGELGDLVHALVGDEVRQDRLKDIMTSEVQVLVGFFNVNGGVKGAAKAVAVAILVSHTKERQF